MKLFCCSVVVLVLLQSLIPVIRAEVPEPRDPDVRAPEKRQLVTGILSAALPTLSNLLLKETHLDKFVGKAVGWVTSFFGGQSGDMPLEGTQMKLHYNVHHCTLHFGKRFLASKHCKAEVSEAHTKTSESCTEGSQEKALKCAVKKEVTKLEALAKAVVAQQAKPKRQLVTGILSAALPTLSNLLLKETHLDKFVGKAVGWVTSFFGGQSGDMPLEGTQMKLHYNVHHCTLHFGKRFLASKRCKAEVSEAHTKTSESCTEGSQEKALKCAVKKEVTKLEALAKAVVAQQAKPKRQLVTGILSAALPSLSNLLLKETHLDKFVGKAVGWVTSFFGGQSGDMPLEGTQMKLHYNVHHCTLHFGKRFLASKHCKAEVSEAHTKTSESCTEGSQEKALKCAVKKEVTKLEALAKAVVAQQAKPKY
ncbi:uncharacterized protein LOC135463155 [Liolophura sinensis]|uniref:uncharacterized protein LOC135463155 n=1 Tax=Liolophura sinensis TaxID=3198878 RepID=UPI00315883FF